MVSCWTLKRLPPLQRLVCVVKPYGCPSLLFLISKGEERALRGPWHPERRSVIPRLVPPRVGDGFVHRRGERECREGIHLKIGLRPPIPQIVAVLGTILLTGFLI